MFDFSGLPSYQIVIKSFRRFRCLKLLVDSILKFHPAAEIIIADDSFEDPNDLPQIACDIRDRPEVLWVQLPFNAGLSAGRTAAVAASTADIIVMCDDDYVFTAETRIDVLLTVLARNSDIDVAAGCIRFDAINCKGWHCVLSREKDGPLQGLPLTTKWHDTDGIRHRPTDLALNWYAARRETLIQVPWDDQFKITMEHIDHFMLMKAAGVSIHYTPDSIVGHEPRSPEDYGEYRMQDVESYVEIFKRKWSVKNRLGFAMHLEPGIPPVSPQTGRSVLIFGVGHSGTTITTRMAEAFGFNAHNADVEYRENTFVRDLNQDCLKSGALDVPAARREIAYMEQAGSPWVLKDPRFVHTIGDWISVFATYQPTMIFVTRDLDAVAESFRSRDEAPQEGDVITRGLALEEAYRLAEYEYDHWPWGKMRIDMAQIADAVRLFDPQRP